VTGRTVNVDGANSKWVNSGDLYVSDLGQGTLNVTAGGLVFIAATNDSRFRAFDKDTGKELWTIRVPASAHATPMTFFSKRTKKQYVVIAAGGHGIPGAGPLGDSLVAFTLP
jgi:quinoprotein glucose dehydrogenase